MFIDKFKRQQEERDLQARIELKEIQEQRSSLIEEIRNAPAENLEGLKTKIKNLQERRNELEKNLLPEGRKFNVQTYEMNKRGGEDMNDDFRATKEYREAFYEVMRGTATPEQRDLVTTTTGSAVIPTNVYEQVVEGIQKEQGLLSKVRILNIPGNLSIPLSDLNTPAAWHTQGAEISDSTLPPGNLELKGYELAKLFSFSAATSAMSMAGYEKYLVEELIRTMGDGLNGSIFAGTGSDQPLGINNLSFDATNSVSGTDIVDLAVQALALLPSNYRKNAAFIGNSATYYKYVAGARDANGNVLFADDKYPGKKAFIVDDFAPDDVVYLGDPKNYIVNFSAPIKIDRSKEAGFTTGTIKLRGLAVVDGKPVTGAFVKMTINS